MHACHRDPFQGFVLACWEHKGTVGVACRYDDSVIRPKRERCGDPLVRMGVSDTLGGVSDLAESYRIGTIACMSRTFSLVIECSYRYVSRVCLAG
jgi:hypothetical protein